MIDVHSHILPGVDDGSKSFEQSLAILKGLSEQGITEVICTPHYIAETMQTSPYPMNLKIITELRQKAKNINIKIHLGNEIYIDLEIAKYLRNRKITPLANSKYLLIELPMTGEFNQYEDIFLSLQNNGWQVILAHPERYQSFQSNFNKVIEMKQQGVLLQCNLGSFIGQYGKHAKKTAQKIAKEHLIFCFGTDIHRERDYNEIKKAQKKLLKYYSETELIELLVANPQKIVQ